MIGLAVVTWLVPLLVGLAAGLWKAREPATNTTEFATHIGLAAMVAALPIFMFHMVWTAAFMMQDGGVDGLGRWAWYWSWLTALVWFPVLVIAYIARATQIKRRKRAGKSD